MYQHMDWYMDTSATNVHQHSHRSIHRSLGHTAEIWLRTWQECAGKIGHIGRNMRTETYRCVSKTTTNKKIKQENKHLTVGVCVTEIHRTHRQGTIRG